MATHVVFIAGATGYMGRALIQRLLARGHTVRALTRMESQHRLPPACTSIVGDALDARTYRDQIAPADTFVHLVGVAHPGPGKAQQFRTIDLKSVQEAAPAAASAGVRHFVYVSVAHPAPIMKVYQQVRIECERIICATGVIATFLRPWYVLGPGHRWPYLILPVYWLLRTLPRTREFARRLGLVTLPQMVSALVFAIENPHEPAVGAAEGAGVIDVSAIRAMRS